MPPATLTRPADIIISAKDLLETDGWTVGAYRCSQGKHCAVGALRAAAGFHPDGPVDPGNTEYVTAIRALAGIVSPKAVRALDKAALDDALAYNECDILEAYEDVIIDFNDSRVRTAAGRDTVLRRFDRAITKLS